DFAGAVVGARDGEGDLLLGQRSVDLVPGGVGIVNQLAVDGDPGGDGLVDMDRLEGEVTGIGRGRKDDAVEADLDFADVVHAGSVAGLDLGGTDAARGIGDVDGV